uniref:Uncharacterized protein n=1 Tax=Tetranychus urticae TaxID=32264 RepID=T1KS59_TETUR
MRFILSQDLDLEPRRFRIFLTKRKARPERVTFFLIGVVLRPLDWVGSPIFNLSLITLVNHSTINSKLSSNSMETSMKGTSNLTAKERPSSLETSRTRTR